MINCYPLFALLFVSAIASAQAPSPARPAPAQSAPLVEAPLHVRQQPLATGDVTHQTQVAVAAGEAPVTVRSIQPDNVIGNYRIDFAALDLDGDGLISLEEAQANPALADEFKALDTLRRGQLDRQQLAGWLIP